jgi:Na+/melibiose symporter-like transporter
MLGVLRNRDFGLLWLGQAISLVGDGIYLVAIAWLVLDISNEPTALGLVGLAWTLPMVASLLIAGVLSDRFERRRLLIVADLVRLVAIGAIAALALAETAELWQVIALVVVYGIGQALFQPAFSAIVPDVVPRDQLLQANAVRELMEPLGLRFVGPALGGLLIAVFGVGEALVLDAATFGVSALAVSLMSRQQPVREETAGLRRDVVEGLAYVRGQPWLWATLVGAALFLLLTFGPMEVLLPYIIKNELGGDAATFGTVLAIGGLGSIVAAVLLSITGLPRRHVTFMWWAWTVGITLDIGLALSGASWQMCVLAFFSFALSTAGLLTWNMLMYTLVPSEMLGRVSSLDWFVSIGLTPVSFALVGPIAEALGARTTLAGAGVLGLFTVAFLYLPGVRDPERMPLAGRGTRVGSAQ